MENFGKKIRIKTFLSGFGWVRRKENKLWGPNVFFPNLQKKFLSKMERKLKREIMHHFWTKMLMCICTWVSSTFIFFKTFFFLFFISWTLPSLPFFFHLDVACPCLFFFFFFLLFFGQGCPVFLFFCVFFWFRCDFLNVHDFYFFNKLRWLIFFFIIYHFFGFN